MSSAEFANREVKVNLYNCHRIFIFVDPGVVRAKDKFAGILVDPQREKTYHRTCTPNVDSDQPAHPRSLSHCCPHEETLHLWEFRVRPVKILIRPREMCRLIEIFS